MERSAMCRSGDITVACRKQEGQLHVTPSSLFLTCKCSRADALSCAVLEECIRIQAAILLVAIDSPILRAMRFGKFEVRLHGGSLVNHRPIASSCDLDPGCT